MDVVTHYRQYSLPEASFSVVWPTNLTIKTTGLTKDVIDSVLSQTYTAQDQDDETEKYVAYGVLLARATSARHRAAPVEKSLLLALYDDLYLSRGFFVPVDLQHAINRVFHSQKRMSSKFIVDELTLRHHQNRLHFTFTVVVRLHVDGGILISHVMHPNNGFYYTSSVDAGSVLSPFFQSIQAAQATPPISSRINNIQERTLRRLMQNMIYLEGTEGSNLLRRIPGTPLAYSVVFQNVYEDAGKSLATRGGILLDVMNPYRLVPLLLSYKSTDDSFREENSQEEFLGTILFCASQTKKLWYWHLQQSGLRVYVYRKSNLASRLRKIPNALDVVVLISHAQAYKEYRGMFTQTPFRQTYAIQTPFNVCFTCSPETPVSLFYVGCRRMIVTDTGQLSTYNAMGIIRKQAARIRWVFSDENQYPSRVDYRLFCNRMVCSNAFYQFMLHSHRLSTNSTGIVPAKTIASTYMTSFSLTPAGHELARQRNGSLFLIENEIGDESALVQTDHMSDEAVNDLDACCICYDSIKEVDGRSFTWLSCGHYLCTTCFTTIRGMRNHVSCPLCRQSSRFPDQIHERTAGTGESGEIQSLPLTTKIEYLQTQLLFSSVPIGCVANRRMHRFLKVHFKPEELNRIVFLSETQANLRLSVDFRLCVFMQTSVARQHSVPVCRCLHQGHRVETVAFTRDRIHDGQEDDEEDEEGS